MTYTITLKSGKVVELHDIVAVDYYNGHLYYSDGEATYTFDVTEVLTAEVTKQ